MPRKRSITSAAPRAHVIAATEAMADARSKSVVRGLAILESFSGEHSLLGIAEVAQIVGFSRSTTHRYMGTLTELGYLVQDPGSRRYRLGRRCSDLGAAALEGARLRDHHDLLEELRRRCSYTVSLASLGAGAVIADVAFSRREGEGEMRLLMRPGTKLPLQSTAIGRALLSGLDQAPLEEVVNQVLSEDGAGESSSEDLLREVAAAREARVLTGEREVRRIDRDGWLREAALPVPVAEQDVSIALAVSMLDPLEADGEPPAKLVEAMQETAMAIASARGAA